MSSLFKSPKPPKVEPVEAAEDVRDIRRRIRGRGGEQATILGQPSGLTGPVPSIFSRNLGGTQRT